MSRLVDIHSHLYPRWYVDALRSRTTPPRVVGDPGDERFVIFAGERGRPMSDDFWDVGRKLAFMDSHGISQTIASLGNPWLDPFEDDAARLAEAANRYFADLERVTGGRIVGMGVLPQHRVAAAASTIREVAGTPGLHGIANGCRMCGRELDDPVLEPVWEALEGTGVPLIIHPHYVAAREALHGYGHAFPVALGFPFETTVAVARLIFGGVLQRYPGLRIVASHGGGTIPYLAGRLDAGWRSDESVRERLPVPPTEDLRKLFLDALVYEAGALRAAASLVGVSRMAFGTDHPFSVSDPQRSLRAIDEAFAGADREAVRSRSAEAFFGLSGDRAPGASAEVLR
jgi:predicted TIM-barrel fold metal-dependent hydrolase